MILKKKKLLFTILMVLIVVFVITVQFVLPTTNSSGEIISRNVYIVVSELFLILFLIGTIIITYIKNSFLNIVRFSFLPSITISGILLLKALGGLNILMEIAIPSAAIILFIIITTI